MPDPSLPLILAYACGFLVGVLATSLVHRANKRAWRAQVKAWQVQCFRAEMEAEGLRMALAKQETAP